MKDRTPIRCRFGWHRWHVESASHRYCLRRHCGLWSRRPRRLKVSAWWEPRDLWIGVYRTGDLRVYVCIIPTVVVCFDRSTLPPHA